MRLLLALAMLCLSASAHAQLLILRAGGSTGPTSGSVVAASYTANNNVTCVGGTLNSITYPAITPFYVEIGDSSAARFSLSVGTPTVTNATSFIIDSVSKFLAAAYIVQVRGGYGSLSSSDINYLNFTSGFTAMPSQTTGVQCTPITTGTVNGCLALPPGCTAGTNGTCYSSYIPIYLGAFFYASSHDQNLFGAQSELNTLPADAIGTKYTSAFGITGSQTVAGVLVHQPFFFNQAQIAGGVYTTPTFMGQFLRKVLSGALLMLGALGQNPVCAYNACPAGPNGGAVSSPLVYGSQWHYAIGSWVEDDGLNGNDGSFSGIGAAGWYSWINSAKTQYGMIARYETPNGATANGQNSQRCALNIRTAWNTGVAQCGATPGTSC